MSDLKKQRRQVSTRKKTSRAGSTPALIALPKQRQKAIKHHLKQQRPFMYRLLLQPAVVLMLVIVGILMAAWTYEVVAADLTVTASVPAAVLTRPAVVTYPADGLRLTTSPITVTGTCPPNSYVELYRNQLMSGVALCDPNGQFQISAALFVGENDLQVQDYNVTNQAGPTNQAISIDYEPTTISSQSSTSGESTPPPILITNYIYQTVKVGKKFSWTMTVHGGTSPYNVNVDWKDGTNSTYPNIKSGSFTIYHTYHADGYYPVLVRITDNLGQFSQIQLAALIQAGVGPVKQSSSLISSAATNLANDTATGGHLLLVAWPFYAVVILILGSFYLGERQELLRLTRTMNKHAKHKS